MTQKSLAIGIMQRNFPIHPSTINALRLINLPTIIIDASPNPIIQTNKNIKVIHQPDQDGFFPISLLIPLFAEFLSTEYNKLFLIEGDMVLTHENILAAEKCTDNTKVFYRESEPENSYAYVRREGLAGVLLRKEVQKIYDWMVSQPLSRFRKYQGYCDTFLWFAISSETTGYSLSTSGPGWIPVLHLTHDDSTRVTKAQRKDMKVYRARLAEIINLALECNYGNGVQK